MEQKEKMNKKTHIKVQDIIPKSLYLASLEFVGPDKLYETANELFVEALRDKVIQLKRMQ